LVRLAGREGLDQDAVDGASGACQTIRAVGTNAPRIRHLPLIGAQRSWFKGSLSGYDPNGSF